MLRPLLWILGIILGPAAKLLRPCMYCGGKVVAGPLHGEFHVGVTPLGVCILVGACALYASFRVLAEEGLVRPLLRALFGSWF